MCLFFNRPRGYETFLMLNSTEHEISTAHKTKIPTNKETSCFTCFKALKCCMYHANECYNANNCCLVEHEKRFITLDPGHSRCTAGPCFFADFKRMLKTDAKCAQFYYHFFSFVLT